MLCKIMLVPFYLNRLFCSETERNYKQHLGINDRIAVGAIQVFKCDKV